MKMSNYLLSNACSFSLSLSSCCVGSYLIQPSSIRYTINAVFEWWTLIDSSWYPLIWNLVICHFHACIYTTDRNFTLEYTHIYISLLFSSVIMYVFKIKTVSCTFTNNKIWINDSAELDMVKFVSEEYLTIKIRSKSQIISKTMVVNWHAFRKFVYFNVLTFCFC